MDETSGEKNLPQGRLARLAKLGRLAAGLAGDLAGAVGNIASGSGKDVAAEVFHKKAAERMLAVLGRMKGLPMKVGQMLSYMDDFIPPDFRHIYTDTLRQLQVKAHPMRWAEIEQAVQKDLGRPISKVFERFDREPIAAASIGQVYRAALPGGREVAVKVQYPGIADAIRSDLKNIDLLRSALGAVLPKFDVERSLADITSRVLEECDYGCELNNQEDFRRLWGGDPHIVIPEPLAEYSGDHVLVTEFVVGKGWRAMLDSAGPDERNHYGRTLFRFVFRSLYDARMFNGDPHPGNYLFLENGKVAFLDFGCVQRFDDATVDGFRDVANLAKAGVTGDRLRQAMVQAYDLPAENIDADEWDFLEGYVLLVMEPALGDRPFRFDRSYTQRLYQKTVQASFLGTKKALQKGVWEAKRPGLIFLNRIQYGLYSILAELGAEARWGRVVEEPPTP